MQTTPSISKINTRMNIVPGINEGSPTEDPDSGSRFLASAPHSDTHVHMGNEGRRGFSGANPPNPSGK